MITRGYEKELILTRGLGISEAKAEIIRLGSHIERALVLESEVP